MLCTILDEVFLYFSPDLAWIQTQVFSDKGRKEKEAKIKQIIDIVVDFLHRQKEHSQKTALEPDGLSIVQLRDAILDDVPMPEKIALWKEVSQRIQHMSQIQETIMERNGEEVRCWEWVGWGLLSPGVSRRFQASPNPATKNSPPTTTFAERIIF